MKLIKKSFLLMSLLLFVISAYSFSAIGNNSTLVSPTLQADIIKDIADLENKEFEVTNPFAGKNVTIGFSTKYSRIYGSTGLNTYFADVKIENGKFKVGYIGRTKREGSQETSRTELHFLDLLKRVDTIKKFGNKLELTSSENSSFKMSLISIN